MNNKDARMRRRLKPLPSQQPYLLLPFLLLSLLTPTIHSTTNEQQCHLYLAPSTTCPPSSGTNCLGLYTTRPIPPGTTINTLTPEMGIDLISTTLFKGVSFTTGDLNLVVPGVGMLPASSTTVTNAEVVHGQEASELGVGEAGEGAFTPYYNVTLRSTRAIQPGEELFFKATSKKTEVFKEAVEAVTKFKRHAEGLKEDLTKEQLHDVWIMIRDVVVEKEVRELLPNSPNIIDKMLESDTPEMHLQQASTSLEYLQNDGYCVDNITPQVSTIPGAGRGAFATRDIEEGDIIAPFIAIPILKSSLAIDPKKSETDEKEELLLNYCYGHADSDIVLFPYASGINYVNHHKKRVNVELVWPEDIFDAFLTADDWYHMTAPELFQNANEPLILYDLVATKDIKAGEELFLDYGDDWEKAWKAHKAKFIREVSSATVWNAKKAWGDAIKTKSEGRYPPNIYLGCLVDMGDLEEKNLVWEKTEGLFHDDNLYFCQINEREEIDGGGFEYTVQMEFTDGDVYEVTKVPHDAIWFMEDNEVVKKQGAFRHMIGVSEDLFPVNWLRDDVVDDL